MADKVKKRRRRSTQEKAIRPSWSLKQRLLFVLIVFGVLFLVLIGRLFYIQVIWGPELQRMALDQWTRTTAMTAERGQILDSKGKVLATNDNVYKVVVWPNLIAASDRERVALELSRLLNMDIRKRKQSPTINIRAYSNSLFTCFQTFLKLR